MFTYLKTSVAARELGVRTNQLMNLIRYGQIPQPGRDSSGDYLWSPAEIERARTIFAARRQKKEAASV
jgi:hypothetical protein